MLDGAPTDSRVVEPSPLTAARPRRETAERFLELPLVVHDVLRGVPLHDVTIVDLPGGEPGRTIADVRALMGGKGRRHRGSLTRALFALRLFVGRVLHWDDGAPAKRDDTYLRRVDPSVLRRSAELAASSRAATSSRADASSRAASDATSSRAGTSSQAAVPSRDADADAVTDAAGSFHGLYELEAESLQEIRNATVHAFLCMALVPQQSGYRLYWAVYVKPVSRFTSLYMAIIEPFRRFVVYPSLLDGLQRTWTEHYGAALH